MHRTRQQKDFLDVLYVLKFGLFAIILKAIVWPLGFIPLIKGNKFLYFKQNVLGDGINVLASILLFYYCSEHFFLMVKFFCITVYEIIFL